MESDTARETLHIAALMLTTERHSGALKVRAKYTGAAAAFN